MLYVAGIAEWRYEPAPRRKCWLLNSSGCSMMGPPLGEWGDEYIAWSPMPKRDKALEKLLVKQGKIKG